MQKRFLRNKKSILFSIVHIKNAKGWARMIDSRELEQLKKIDDKYKCICRQLTYEEVYLDKALSLSLEKQKRDIEEISLLFEKYEKMSCEYEEFRGLVSIDNDKRLSEEISQMYERLLGMSHQLRLLLARLDGENSSIVVEVARLGSGEKLYECLIGGYSNFCIKNNFEYTIKKDVNYCQFFVDGINADKVFLKECGEHISTSGEKCQVFVYERMLVPAVEDKDIRVETFRSSGAGGQHINTTDSAIRATYIPTGMCVVCQDERSQLQNRAKAIRTLKNKVEECCQEEVRKQIEAIKRKQILANKKSSPKKVFDFGQEKIVSKEKTTFDLLVFENGDRLN